MLVMSLRYIIGFIIVFSLGFIMEISMQNRYMQIILGFKNEHEK